MSLFDTGPVSPYQYMLLIKEHLPVLFKENFHGVLENKMYRKASMYYSSPQFNLFEIHVGVVLHLNRFEFPLIYKLQTN